METSLIKIRHTLGKKIKNAIVTKNLSSAFHLCVRETVYCSAIINGIHHINSYVFYTLQ